MLYVASTSLNIRREMLSVLMNYGEPSKASEVPYSRSNSYIIPYIYLARPLLSSASYMPPLPMSNVRSTSTVVSNQEQIFKDLTNIGMKVFEGNTFSSQRPSFPVPIEVV